MKFSNVYFINGTAYAGKSTMVKLLAEKYDGVLCEENYHDALAGELSSEEFPNLTYTRDLKNWSDFVRRTPEQYEEWIEGVTKECTILELRILEKLKETDKKIFVDTNIPVDVLHQISDMDHVVIMLADPEISVNRFFDRPDKEKQFLYQLLLKEENPQMAIENFRECLKRVNSKEIYDNFLNSGFHVILRDENRSIEETLRLVEQAFKLQGGADGPTSVFIAKKSHKRTLRQKLNRLMYQIRRTYVEKTLTSESHSMDEVMEYIVNKYCLKQNEERIKRAMEIPTTVFDIDFHKYAKAFDDRNDNMDIIIEKKYGYIGGGASGNKKLIFYGSCNLMPFGENPRAFLNALEK